MHYQENKNERLLNKAKKLLFEHVPYTISVFEEEDATYFIFSELGDYIVENIDNEDYISPVIAFVELLLSMEEEVIETLVVIELFQKVYLSKNIDAKFGVLLKSKSREIFERYRKEHEKWQ